MNESQASQKILLAVDESDNAKRAVNYVGSMLRHSSNGFRVTLLHIIREPDCGAFATEEERTRQIESRCKRVMEFLSAYRDQLIEAGMPEQAVNIRCPLRQCPSLAESIMSERDLDGYATIVVGRHRLSRVEEFLYGSVSARLVNNASNCAVWVIA